MAKKFSIHLTWLLAVITLVSLALLLTGPSWSSPADLFVTSSAPETLPLTSGTDITLNGGGFSPTTSLWLVPERSLRSTTTATLATYGNPQHFIERDGHLYVANGTGGFFIVQGLTAANPWISGVVNSEGQGVEIVLHQEEAIMAAGRGGLQIIDIRDAGNPQLLAVLKAVAPALSVASTGKIGYVATGKSGVQIVDLSDPRNPRRLGTMANLPEAYKVSCDKEILIVATGRGGEIYDIRQPERPRHLGQLPVVGEVSNSVMTRRGETLYWATKTLQESRLYSIDLSRPQVPRIQASARLNGTPMGISWNEDQVAVALASSGTDLFALADKSRLTPLCTIAAKSRTRFALSLGDDIWIGDGGGEVLRIDKRNAAAFSSPAILPEFFSRIPPLVTSQNFILGDEVGLAVYARGDGARPVLVARLAIPGLIQQYLSADQKRLWLAVRNIDPPTGGRLIGVDISVPHSPRITAEIPLAVPPVLVGEVGTTLVVATSSLWEKTSPGLNSLNRPNIESLQFIDISLPAAPALFLDYPLGISCSGVTLAGSTLALMQTDGLFRLLDLADKDAPKESGSLQMPWLHVASWSAGRANIHIKDKVAFLSSPLGEIVVISLHHPAQMEIMGEYILDGPVSSILASDRFLFAETKTSGLTVIDINNPLEPALLGTIPLPGFNHVWTAQGETLWYVINECKGIYPLPMPRRLQNATADNDKFVTSLTPLPPPGAYRWWLTDEQSQILIPGVTWVKVAN